MNEFPQKAPRKAIERVPLGLRTMALYAACLLLLTAAFAVLAYVLWQLSAVVIPFLIGLILAALLVPLSTRLQHWHWPRWAAILCAWLVLLLGLLLLAGVLGVRLVDQLPAIGERMDEAGKAVKALLERHLPTVGGSSMEAYKERLTDWLNEHAPDLGLQTLLAGRSVVRTVAGVFLAVFVALFAMIDGVRIWRWVVRLLPAAVHAPVHRAGQAGWSTLVQFVRVQILVAAIDAIGIGLGVLLLGVPLALPITLLVLVGALVPIVGSIVAGGVAVLVALLFKGWVIGLVLLIIVLVIHQLEGHVLQPLLAGNMLGLHPLAVVLSVVTGIALAGVTGAFFAVPVLAVGHAMLQSLHVRESSRDA